VDAFTRRLVERLMDPARPLTRNRHFHTLDNPEGRRALRISRRLLGLQKDLVRCQREGGAGSVTHHTNAQGEVVVELTLRTLNAARTTVLDATEFELLCRLPGLREALTHAPELTGDGDARATSG
jgi:hypothetical protein